MFMETNDIVHYDQNFECKQIVDFLLLLRKQIS